MKFNQEIYEHLQVTNPSLATTYLKEHPEQLKKSKGKIKKIYPRDLLWWQHKRFTTKKNRFKFLEAILIAFYELPHLSYNNCKKLIYDSPNPEKHLFILNGKGKIPAFLELNCKTEIAKKVGCSIYTMKEYIAMLVRCEILRVDNFVKGRIYISVGYWRNYFEDGIKNIKIQKYMNKEVGKNLLNPEKAYLRKHKNKKQQKRIRKNKKK
jgi:hypothetical protein